MLAQHPQGCKDGMVDYSSLLGILVLQVWVWRNKCFLKKKTLRRKHTRCRNLSMWLPSVGVVWIPRIGEPRLWKWSSLWVQHTMQQSKQRTASLTTTSNTLSKNIFKHSLSWLQIHFQENNVYWGEEVRGVKWDYSFAQNCQKLIHLHASKKRWDDRRLLKERRKGVHLTLNGQCLVMFWPGVASFKSYTHFTK